MDIDKLEGKGLSLEVAKKLGSITYTDDEYYTMLNANAEFPEDTFIVGSTPMCLGDDMPQHYNPHEDLEKALLLDRLTYCMELYVDLNLTVMCCFQDLDRKRILYASKTAPQPSQVIQTMATCVCRCWLKMMEE